MLFGRLFSEICKDISHTVYIIVPFPGFNGVVAWLDEPAFPHNKLSRSVNGERQTSTENG